MTDSIRVFPPGFRVTDEAGATVSQAKLKFYLAGTTTPLTVYSDDELGSSLGTTVYCGSDGFPVASLGSSTEVAVYTGTADFKLTITDLDDVAILTLDDLSGALDTSTFLTSSSASTLSIPVITKTSNYTLTSADRGKLVQGNTTGGNFTLTLTAAATLGDGWNCEIRNSGTSGQLLLSTSDTVAFEGQTFTLRAFEIGEAAAIRCNGTGFELIAHTPPLMARRGTGVIAITDIVTSAPVAPTPGARYIVGSSFSTYTTHDIIEANGSSFNKYTPATDAGWVAFVQDENRYYSFQDSAWVLGMDPAASDTVSGLVELAVQSEMETATDVVRAVVPGRQKYHPAHPKAWVEYTSVTTTTNNQSSGVTSLTDNGAGNTTVTLSTAMSVATYAILATAQRSASDSGFTATVKQGSTVTGSAFTIATANVDTAALEDSPYNSAAVIGDI